jgi:hypothetical protein
MLDLRGMTRFRPPLSGCSRDGAQILTEAIRVAIRKKSLNGNVGLSPDGNGPRKQRTPLRCQRHDPAAPVRWIHRDPKQVPALQWLKSGGQCRPIHAE